VFVYRRLFHFSGKGTKNANYAADEEGPLHQLFGSKKPWALYRCSCSDSYLVFYLSIIIKI
jgi:hypothetical protein